MYIQKIKTEDELKQCLQLREEVFCNEQGVELKDEIDVFDDVLHKKSIHILVLEKNEVIATLRLINCVDYVKIGRVAVKKEYRGRDVGKKMMDFAIDMCLDDNIFNCVNKYFYLESQVYAITFYEKLGFKAEGPEFLDCNIPHRIMKYLVI